MLSSSSQYIEYFDIHLYKHKGETDLVLFTKWDRFSRNAADAYQMINILRKLGIEPQAIEQPLDLTVPENKMMLAFYLAVPEVENERRALNVLTGMRRAKKVCPRCGRMLTGSGSKGRKLHYSYYHYSSICGIRYRADLANREFIREIKKYVPHPAALELHKKVIREGYEYQMKDEKDNCKRMIKQVSELNKRIVRARNLLLSGDIEATDFRTIKMDCEKQITILEEKLHSTWGDGGKDGSSFNYQGKDEYFYFERK